MFETDSIPAGWVERLNFMDEIWVPTLFSKDIFEKFGVKRSKLRIVGEPVDTHFYSPMSITLQMSKYIFDRRKSNFNFLFVGKWEKRKGISYLLNAYLTEFSREKSVSLIILTSAYHTDSNFKEKLLKMIEEVNVGTKGYDLNKVKPNIQVVADISMQSMPVLYNSVDALVIPSLGEGWGQANSLLCTLSLSPF